MKYVIYLFTYCYWVCILGLKFSLHLVVVVWFNIRCLWFAISLEHRELNVWNDETSDEMLKQLNNQTPGDKF